MVDTYAVMGNPVAHSKSPLIHSEFAKQTGQDLQYLKIEVPLDQLSVYLDQFQREHGRGLNITVPFKEDAYHWLEQHTERASMARAVNTIKFFEDGTSCGDNTDGIGFMRDLQQHEFSVKGKKVLIIGAGGAARGIIPPLLEQNPEEITIVNRTPAKAISLAQDFQPYGRITTTTYEQLAHPFELIINASSMSLSQQTLTLPTTILGRKTFCYDLMYSQHRTVFLQWACEHGITQLADGLGMLVEQAAESFFLWRGVRPDTRRVIQLLTAG